jgi:hypothetical protein
MNVNSRASGNDGRPSAAVLQQLKDGSINPKALTVEERQQCVEVCILEGYTIHQIAQLFRCSEKTISRDIAAIRERNAMTPNLEFAKQMVGDVYQKIMSHHDYLVRLAKNSDASVAEKVGAIFAACKALTDLVELFQSVGYMPLRPQQITGDIYHHKADEEARSLVELKGELAEFERAAVETGLLDETARLQMKLIEKKIEEAEITQQLLEAKQSVQDKNVDDNNKEVSNG